VTPSNSWPTAWPKSILALLTSYRPHPTRTSRCFTPPRSHHLVYRPPLLAPPTIRPRRLQSPATGERGARFSPSQRKTKSAVPNSHAITNPVAQPNSFDNAPRTRRSNYQIKSGVPSQLTSLSHRLRRVLFTIAHRTRCLLKSTI